CHKLVGRREGPHRRGQIAVGSAVTRHEASDSRQDVIEVPEVQRPEGWRGGNRELENGQTPAWLQHAIHLAAADDWMLNVADTEGDGERIDRAIGQRDPLRIAAHEGDALRQSTTNDLL